MLITHHISTPGHMQAPNEVIERSKGPFQRSSQSTVHNPQSALRPARNMAHYVSHKEVSFAVDANSADTGRQEALTMMYELMRLLRTPFHEAASNGFSSDPAQSESQSISLCFISNSPSLMTRRSIPSGLASIVLLPPLVSHI